MWFEDEYVGNFYTFFTIVEYDWLMLVEWLNMIGNVI